MSILKEELTVSNNILTSYFPARTSNSPEAFDWQVAQGLVVRNIYRKEVNRTIISFTEDSQGSKVDTTLDNFKYLCKADFEKRLDEVALWDLLEKMYFSGKAFYEVAPESLLFRITSLKGSSKQRLLGDMFASLIGGFHIEKPTRQQRNFLEQQVVDSLRSTSVLSEYKGEQRLSSGINEKPYLPFLSKLFRKDIAFLVHRPKYLLERLSDLLKLYGYLYTAQLALNINGWQSMAEPTSKPLFFIMENETASKERTDLVNNGHQKVSRQIEYIFPYLSMSESLQKTDKTNNIHRVPLWSLVSKLQKEDSAKLAEYAQKFAEDRNSKKTEYVFPYDKSNEDPIYWIKALLELAKRQFDKGESRAAAQGKFIKATEDELCSEFVKSRGQVGRVLVINQDYVELLTNLAIGEKEKLRFHELIEEFQARGVYFDKQSQQVLIQFYERVGNVERMSDSGDAVYVRRTV